MKVYNLVTLQFNLFRSFQVTVLQVFFEPYRFLTEIPHVATAKLAPAIHGASSVTQTTYHAEHTMMRTPPRV